MKICRIIERYLDTGSVEKGKFATQSTQNVSQIVVQNCHISIRRLFQQIGAH